MDSKETFKSIVKEYISRDGIDALMQWLESTDFYSAPSSARYHAAYPGGLCDHSIAVYNRLKSMQDNETDETIAIVALFHDLCKVNFYKESTRNVKDEDGRWIKVPYYEYRQDDPLPLGHGEKSVIMILRYMQLTDEEILAIRWHMGGYYSANPAEAQALSQALGMYRLVLKLQTADCQSAFWDKI